MFEIGWTEILLIAVVAIVVIGPKDLPRAMRLVGQWTGRLKRMAGEFQRQFNQALKEAELDDVRKDVEAIAKGDPFASVKQDMARIEAGIRSDMSKAAPGTSIMTPAAPAATPPAAATPAAASTAPVEAAPTAKGEP